MAALFRSNGILLTIFIGYGMVLEPRLSKARIRRRRGKEEPILNLLLPQMNDLLAVLLSSITVLPFMGHLYGAFSSGMCGARSDELMQATLFSTVRRTIGCYGYIQLKYWNVGFLRYWTPAQAPNLILAAPLIGLMSYSCFKCRRSTAHGIHAVVIGMLLVFNSHTQIVLRLSSSMPIMSWGMARLAMENTDGRNWRSGVWVGGLWGITGVMVWGCFLPPA
jgi:GPI mannosyltransferase 2